MTPREAVEENTAALTEALDTVDTMQITYAARNSDFDGYDIHEGDYLALYGSQLFGTSQDIRVLLKSLAEKVRDDGKEYHHDLLRRGREGKARPEGGRHLRGHLPQRGRESAQRRTAGILLPDFRRITRKRKNNTETDLPAALRAAGRLV